MTGYQFRYEIGGTLKPAPNPLAFGKDDRADYDVLHDGGGVPMAVWGKDSAIKLGLFCKACG
jgi:hypothetical protein